MTPKDIYDFHEWFRSNFEHLLASRYRTFYQALMLAVARNAKVLVEKGTGRIKGAHLLRRHADEAIHAFASAVKHGVTAKEIRAGVFAFPTVTSDRRYGSSPRKPSPPGTGAGRHSQQMSRHGLSTTSRTSA